MKKPIGSPIASSILSYKIENNSPNNERRLSRINLYIDSHSHFQLNIFKNICQNRLYYFERKIILFNE